MTRKSEFHAATGGDGRALMFEFVPNAQKPRDIYVVLDGQRIARRDRTGRGVWVPMVPGYEVIDTGPNTIAVTYRDPRLSTIGFGKVRYLPGAPKNLPRWTWACQCPECESIEISKRLHGPFKTRREAERNAEQTLLLLASEPETGRLLS